MLPWIRPQAHATFANEAAKLLAEVRIKVANRGGTSHGEDFEGREMWNASWKQGKLPSGIHKETLVGALPEYAKCAWCERSLRWKGQLDVDHYRPKGKVTRWDGNPPIVSNIGPDQTHVDTGYWWLAFSWENYSLACGPCNREFKRNLFPVVEPRAACVEGVESTEKPLLLDPSSPFRVRDHFSWTFEGIMEGISDEGRATIITCGLNRQDLRALRLKVAGDTKREIDRLIIALRERDRLRKQGAFAEIAKLGARTAEFTSMVRWLVEEHLGTYWDKLPGMPA